MINPNRPCIGCLPVAIDYQKLLSSETLRRGMDDCHILPRHQEYLLARWKKYLPVLEEYMTSYLQAWCDGNWDGVLPAKFFQEPDASPFFLTAYCLLSRVSLEVYRSQGLSDELWQDNMPDINWHLHEFGNGELWLDTADWAVNWHITIQIAFNVKLGRLQFAPFFAKEDFPGLGINKGDLLVNTHIPAVGRMDTRDCLQAFEKAEKFFVPRIGDFKAFYCHSWLLNPLYKKYLPQTSNIVQFQNLGIVFPDNNPTEADALQRVFYYYREDPFTPTPRSSVQRAVQQMLLKREPLNAGIMIRPRQA